MKFLIFSDLDGTFLNHNTYSYGTLKNYINNLDLEFELIFVTSKTFEEILEIQNKLNINHPFIAENGACIFFPPGYLKHTRNTRENFFIHNNHYCYKMSNLKSDDLINSFSDLKKKYKFCFYSELSNESLCKLTKLKLKEAENSKIRLFTNPIFWKDTNEKLLNFKSDVMKINKGLKILKGGRFFHISDNYNKAKAVKNFIKTIKLISNDRFLTVSLGDSENDICMLESTDYSCIVKREENKISLKKKDNIYFSKTEAPDGWRESLEFVIRMESKNF